MTDQLDIEPDLGRVIARLAGRIADLESEKAQLQDVIVQLLDRGKVSE